MLDILVVQKDSVVGDISNNLKLIEEALNSSNSDIVIFPEMFLSGYPLYDMVHNKYLIDSVNSALEKLASYTKKQALLVGAPYWDQKGRVYNSVYLFKKGKREQVFFKEFLPNNSNFDESHYFSKGYNKNNHFSLKNYKIGVFVCEDFWHTDKVKEVSEQSDLLIVANGSPFTINKNKARKELLKKNFSNYKKPILYTNLIGAQDEIVFDGASMKMDSQGLDYIMPAFSQSSCKITFNGKNFSNFHNDISYPDKLSSIYEALVMGLRGYANKTGFSKVILGISGGIDSALCASLASDALGCDNVSGIFMPYVYTSEISKRLVGELATSLNISIKEIPIDNLVDNFTLYLQGITKSLKTKDVVLQNIQARVRSMILSTLVNVQNKLWITTGNKSELSLGYTTLYGDMSGMFNPLKDVYKTTVFELAKRRNETKISASHLGHEKNVIPNEIITRAPTAELAFDQKDQDDLPEYNILDKLLKANFNDSDIDITDPSFKDIAQRVLSSEFKRFQSCPGVMISDNSFGISRRYPVVNSLSNEIKKK